MFYTPRKRPRELGGVRWPIAEMHAAISAEFELEMRRLKRMAERQREG
jgi:hypothetical protein